MYRKIAEIDTGRTGKAHTGKNSTNAGYQTLLSNSREPGSLSNLAYANGLNLPHSATEIISTVSSSFTSLINSDARAQHAMYIVQKGIVDILINGNFEIFENVFAPEFIDHTAQPGESKADRDSVRNFYGIVRKAFPDLTADIHWQIADGGRVTTYTTYSGTHHEEFFGLKPTGRKMDFESVDVMLVQLGQITDHWCASGLLSLFQKQGGIPENDILFIVKQMFGKMAFENIPKYQMILHPPTQVFQEDNTIRVSDYGTVKYINASSRIAERFFKILETQFPISSSEHNLRLKTPRDYADLLFIHVNHLNKAVREIFGKNTSEIIASRMTKEAITLLRQTNYTIAEISNGLGFEHPTNFNKFFKKQTGKTPKMIRTGKDI